MQKCKSLIELFLYFDWFFIGDRCIEMLLMYNKVLVDVDFKILCCGVFVQLQI